MRRQVRLRTKPRRWRREIDTSPHITPAVYLTAEIPGIGGTLKACPEDFLVEELPLYTPSGEGEHIYLLVEKRGMNAMEMYGLIAKHFRVKRSAVGYAGLKDKQAITRQVVSVHTPGKTVDDFPHFSHDQVKILWADQHDNKLRRGHLAGNRFSIKVRGSRRPRCARPCWRCGCLRNRACPSDSGRSGSGISATTI